MKSAQQMVVTANDLRDAGVQVPLLVGGAALSEKYTTGKIAPSYTAPTFYAKDAMTGLRHDERDHGSGDARRAARRRDVLGFRGASRSATWAKRWTPGRLAARRSVRISRFRRCPISIAASGRLPQLQEIWSYINPFMLYGRHMGYKGNFEKQLLQREEKALDAVQHAWKR